MTFISMGGVMFFWILILGIAGLGIYWFMVKRKDKKVEHTDIAVDATLKDVEPGDIVSINGLGENFEDVDFLIEKIHRYESNKGKWFELVGRYKNDRLYIEWEEEDQGLFITATKNRKACRLSEIGMEENDLVKFDDEASSRNIISFQNKTFSYVYSSEVEFFEDNKSSNAEGFYLWDFISEDGDEVLSVEKWEGEPFEVFFGSVIQDYNVTVYKK